jgi:hypothetical protein
LSKYAKKQLAWETLKYHQKLRFWFFSKQILICRGCSKAYAHRLDFQYNNFLYAFLLSKNGLYMWILVYPLVENIFFLNVPHLLWVWDFVDIYVTHLETRIKCCTIRAYLVFWAFKTLLSPFGTGEKNFFVNFNS